jgi:actin-related protein
MTSKFEQLIEYVINDEEAKAKELFHDIVVEKSREIYENLMDESEELDEESTHDEDEKAEKAGRKVAKDIEYDDKKDRMDEEEEEDLEEMMGGDASDDLITDVEAEEQGMQEEEEMDVEMDSEESSDDNIEDRVVDLEDKLDELMAEFEALMGDDGDSVDDMDGGDDLEMDDTDTADFGMDDEEVEMGMMEAVSLTKVAPAKMGDDGANTKSVVPQNSGAKGAMAHPVKMTGDTAQGRPAPKTGELIGKVQNSVGGNKTMSPATKPVTTQATGVNTKTPFPKA